MQNKVFIKNLFKVTLLVATLIISYFICMLVFFSTFGTGGQGSEAINKGYGFLIIIIPLIITIFLGFKLFLVRK